MKQKEWPWVLGLSGVGFADSLYLLLYQTRKISRLVCPIFGEGCEKVVDSKAAHPRGIPDAVFGVAGYAAAGATAVVLARTSGRAKRTLAGISIAGAAVAVGLSAYLTYAQPKKTGAWCFWCLLSAGVSTAMAAITISGARKVLAPPVPFTPSASA